MGQWSPKVTRDQTLKALLTQYLVTEIISFDTQCVKVLHHVGEQYRLSGGQRSAEVTNGQ